MWFLLFSLGAVGLGAAGLPAARRLPVPPPPEALVACYFLLAALLRLLVRNARLASFERKARKLARRKEDKPGSALGELGLGVGRGAVLAVGGDVLGAGLSLASALLRGATSSFSAPPPAPVERRRAALRERIKATACIAGVGLVCAGVAWEPMVRGRLTRAAAAAMAAWEQGAAGGIANRNPASPQRSTSGAAPAGR
jgi:hypothetical protein